MKYKHQVGFTLMELMIVVAVIGILSAIAFPAYTDSILKGKRAQARTALAELMQQQERYMTQQNCYMAFTTDTSTAVSTAVATAVGASACGITAATSVPFKTFSGDNLSNAAYTLASEACSSTISIAECIRVVATPKVAEAKVGTLSITSSGTKACTAGTDGTTPAATFCWP